MQGNFDFETYDRVVRKNYEEALDDERKAEANLRQKKAARRQAERAIETWEETKEEYLLGLEERQNGTVKAN